MGEQKENHAKKESTRRQRLAAGLKPFRLVKFFSFSSLVVILIFTIFLSVAISKYAKKIILEQSEEYSVAFAENLNLQVFRRFVLIMAIKYKVIQLSNPVQFETLDRIIREIIQGMNVESVTIFDSKVNVISYSTTKERVGVKDAGREEYRLALTGTTNSTLVSSGSVFNLIPGTRPVQCTLKTYIPFRQVGAQGEVEEHIMGVIEIVKDLSSDYKAIIRLQGLIICVSSLVMMVLFVVLQTIVMNASKKVELWVEERLQLEEKLNHSERLAHLGSMIATVSHEIKSPLGIIRSTAEILEKRIRKVAPGNEQLAGIIINETNRLNNITVEFLDFARPQQVKLQRKDINMIVQHGLEFIVPLAAESSVEIVTELAPTPLFVDLDSDLFYRALLNILVNALQAMERQDGGTLTVLTRAVPDGYGCEIEISDTGKGMSEEILEHIFDPFFTSKHKGTGLGLAITKNIIDNHNGKIDVQSEDGKGSIFRIFLS